MRTNERMTAEEARELLPLGATLEVDDTAPMRASVWMDGDIVGAGHTIDSAMDEALEQFEAWEIV